MSKIAFEDKSFVELKKSTTPGKVILTLQAVVLADQSKKIINNSVEMTLEEVKHLISDILS